MCTENEVADAGIDRRLERDEDDRQDRRGTPAGGRAGSADRLARDGHAGPRARTGPRPRRGRRRPRGQTSSSRASVSSAPNARVEAGASSALACVDVRPGGRGYYRGKRQRDLERRSHADGAGDAHLASVGIDDRLHDRQTEAEPAARVPAPARVGSREPIEDVIEVGRRDPGPRVADRDHRPWGRCRWIATSIVSCSCVWFTAFSIKASSATSRRSASAITVASSAAPSSHRRGVAVHRRRASITIVSRSTTRGMQELGVLAPGEQEQPIGEAPQPHQLVGDHGGVFRDRRVGGAPLDQLRVSERDRDRRTQLVRGVLHEPLLPLEQAKVRHRDVFGLLHRRETSPRVPDHRQEHRRHQRDLGELVERGHVPPHVDPDQRARRHHHEGEDPQRGAGLPHPEAVEDGEAHPDEVERHRLPFGESGAWPRGSRARRAPRRRRTSEPGSATRRDQPASIRYPTPRTVTIVSAPSFARSLRT